MEALKITEKIIQENTFEHKKKKPGLNTLVQALIGLRTTGTRVFSHTYLISKGFEKWNVFLPEQHAFHPI